MSLAEAAAAAAASGYASFFVSYRTPSYEQLGLSFYVVKSSSFGKESYSDERGLAALSDCYILDDVSC